MGQHYMTQVREAGHSFHLCRFGVNILQTDFTDVNEHWHNEEIKHEKDYVA